MSRQAVSALLASKNPQIRSLVTPLYRLDIRSGSGCSSKNASACSRVKMPVVQPSRVQHDAPIALAKRSVSA